MRRQKLGLGLWAKVQRTQMRFSPRVLPHLEGLRPQGGKGDRATHGQYDGGGTACSLRCIL